MCILICWPFFYIWYKDYGKHKDVLLCRKRCLSSHKLTGFTTDRGLLTVDGLFHKHPNDAVPTGNRIYRITVHLEDNSTITKESNPFRVDGMCYIPLHCHGE